MLLHHQQESLHHLRLVHHPVFKKVLQVAADDRQRRPQLMGGVGHEILADLFELVLGCHVTNHDASVGVATWSIR